MRLVAGHDKVAMRESGGGDLLSLGWGGLGKLVQIESLALMGTHFEEIALADPNLNPDLDRDLDMDRNTHPHTGEGFVRGDVA